MLNAFPIDRLKSQMPLQLLTFFIEACQLLFMQEYQRFA